MGQPTGYEGAEGFDAFSVARNERDMLGFAQAMLPEGWINWIGVVPRPRRQGIGRLLVADLARQVREARGTHLAALVRGGHARLRLPARPRLPRARRAADAPDPPGPHRLGPTGGRSGTKVWSCMGGRT